MYLTMNVKVLMPYCGRSKNTFWHEIETNDELEIKIPFKVQHRGCNGLRSLEGIVINKTKAKKITTLFNEIVKAFEKIDFELK